MKFDATSTWVARVRNLYKKITSSCEARIFLGALTHSTIHQHLLLETHAERANNGARPRSASQNHRHINGNGAIMVSQRQNEGAYNASAVYIYMRCACRKVHECRRIGVWVYLQFIRTRVVAWPPETEGRPQRESSREFTVSHTLSRTSLILTETGRVYLHYGRSKMHRSICLIFHFLKFEIEFLKLVDMLL